MILLVLDHILNYSLINLQIRQLCITAKEIFMSQPNLLELEAPIKICGTLLSGLQMCRCVGRMIESTEICM